MSVAWTGRTLVARQTFCLAGGDCVHLCLQFVVDHPVLYPEWIAGGLVSMAFWIGIVVWLFSTVRSVRDLPALITPRIVSEQPDRFPEAREAYLGQQWAEAEGLLVDVLAIEPRYPPRCSC